MIIPTNCNKWLLRPVLAKFERITPLPPFFLFCIFFHMSWLIIFLSSLNLLHICKQMDFWMDQNLNSFCNLYTFLLIFYIFGAVSILILLVVLQWAVKSAKTKFCRFVLIFSVIPSFYTKCRRKCDFCYFPSALFWAKWIMIIFFNNLEKE